MAFRTNKTPVLQEKTASGSVASFNTILQKPLVNGEFSIQAYQEGSGDPNPIDNIRPIHGFSEVNTTRCGVNQWDEEWEVGTISSTTGQNAGYSQSYRTKNYIPLQSGINYYVYIGGNYTLGLRYYDINKNFIEPRAISGSSILRWNSEIPARARFMRFVNISTNTYANDISVNYPSTDTAYHAYTGNTYTIQLGQEVYGAEVDVVNGVAHVTHEMVKYDGSENGWVWFDTFNQSSIWLPHNAVYEYLNITGYISDYFKSVSNADRNTNIGNYCSLVGSGSQVAFSSSETSLNNFKSWLSNHNTTFVYELAEPFDIQLTPQQIETLIGNNTIFCDTGDTSLVYNDLDIAKRGSFREVFKLP